MTNPMVGCRHRTTDYIPVRGQSQNRKDAEPEPAPDDTRVCRRGDRVSAAFLPQTSGSKSGSALHRDGSRRRVRGAISETAVREAGKPSKSGAARQD